MSVKFSIARISLDGEHFEILVKPDLALQYKQGKNIGVTQILAIEEIYTDANKGTRPSSENVLKCFGTEDPIKISTKILKDGDLQLTTEQRRKMVEDKRKQIISFISRNCIDPRTGTPHPPLRIEQALSKVRAPLDPFKSVEEQSKNIIDQLKIIIPIRMEKVKVAIKIEPQYAPKAYSIVKSFVTITREEWQKDGAYVGVLEMPAGVYGTFIDKVGKVTKGTIQSKILK